MNKILFILFSLSIASCSAPKTAATTATSTPIAETKATSEPVTNNSPLVGSWKLTNIEFLHTAEQIPADDLKKFGAKMVEKYKADFSADYKYHFVTAEQDEDGVWSQDAKFKTFYTTSKEGTDTFHILKATPETLSLKLNSKEGNVANFSLQKIK